MAVISINYTEPDQSTYKSTEISFSKGDKISFDSGNFCKDWFKLKKTILTGQLNERKDLFPLCHSSSVDHFIMDGSQFESIYLRFKDDNIPYLSKEYSQNEESIELFIEANTNPTWEELKELYNN